MATNIAGATKAALGTAGKAALYVTPAPAKNLINNSAAAVGAFLREPIAAPRRGFFEGRERLTNDAGRTTVAGVGLPKFFAASSAASFAVWFGLRAANIGTAATVAGLSLTGGLWAAGSLLAVAAAVTALHRILVPATILQEPAGETVLPPGGAQAEAAQEVVDKANEVKEEAKATASHTAEKISKSAKDAEQAATETATH